MAEQHLSSTSMLPQRERTPPTFAEPGRLRFVIDRGPWQRSLRWELTPKRDRRLFWIAGSIAILGTLFELVGFGFSMRNRHARPSTPQIITVELIEPVNDLPLPPEPEPPVGARTHRVKVALPEAKHAPSQNTASDTDTMPSRVDEDSSTAARLFNPDGSVRLGNTQFKLPEKPNTERDAAVARWRQIDAAINPLGCKKTRFSDAFAPDIDAGDKVASEYLKWVGLADFQAIRHRAEKRAESGGCEPPK